MNTRYSRPTSWPISLKIPLLVALLMIIVSIVVTERVLSKLSELQDQQLRELSGTYLDGLSLAIMPHVLRKDIWEIYDTIDRTRGLYKTVNVVSTIVSDPNNVILAASDPVAYPTGLEMPAAIRQNSITESSVRIQTDRPKMTVYRNIQYQQQTIGRLTVQLDVTNQLVERFKVRATLIAGNALLTLLLAAIGYMLTMHMTKPMRILSEHLDDSREGDIHKIDRADFANSSAEITRLYASYNAMVQAVNDRDQIASRLFEEEKLASLGRLASAMAHEINNPLGGMLNTISTLKVYGETAKVREKSLGLLERGLRNIGDVVQSTLHTYRGRSDKRPLSESDIADLRLLLRPEIRRRNQKLDWHMNWSGNLPVDGTKTRQICLNLLLNASSAAGLGGSVNFQSMASDTALTIIVENDGLEISTKFLDLLNLTQSGRVPLEGDAGIGLWVICRLVDEMGGQKSGSFDNGISSIKILLPLKKEGILDAA